MSTITSRDNSTLIDNKYTNQNGEIFSNLNEVKSEMPYYISFLKNKRVYIPNTKKTVSIASRDAFVEYFESSSVLNKFGIKELSYSYYDENSNFILITFDGKKISRMEIDASDDDSRLFNVMKQIDKVDVVIGNPEGCKVNDLVRYIYLSKKDFIFSVNKLFTSYKIAYGLLENNDIFFGYNLPKKFFNVKKNKMENRGDMMWISSFDNCYKPKFVDTLYTTKYHVYDKYENCDAINVDCIKMIPMDYKGVMGVPATIACHLNWEQFELVGELCTKAGIVNGKKVHARLLIRFRNN